MNYEKRYKEMLAKARAFYKKWDGVDAYNSSLAISELKEIFPELKVSKKERIEKQGEQNHVDKVESKFNVGDWITNGACTWRIDSIEDDMYYSNCGRFSCGGDIKSIDEQYHLWTIEDAKDGDVLCTYECDKPKIVFILKKNPIVFILKGTSRKHYVFNYHCYYNIMYPCFESNFKIGCLAPNKEDVKPATEEQRNLLFQKMKEFGYEWDANKKELIKL